MFWIKKTLKLVYYATFESHLCYASLARTQNTFSQSHIHFIYYRKKGKIPQDHVLSESEFPHRPFI